MWHYNSRILMEDCQSDMFSLLEESLPLSFHFWTASSYLSSFQCFIFNSDHFQNSFTSQGSRVRMPVLEYWLCANCIMPGKLLHLYNSIPHLQNKKAFKKKKEKRKRKNKTKPITQHLFWGLYEIIRVNYKTAPNTQMLLYSDSHNFCK